MTQKIDNGNSLAEAGLKGRAIARNTAVNFAGLVLPLAVGLAAIPSVVHGLGVARFGILSLVWVVFGYFGLFDLGMGRATTKYIAEALGRKEFEKLPAYLWTTLGLQSGAGLTAAAVLALAAPFIVERLLNIPAELVDESIRTMKLVAISLPVMFLSSSFRGSLEAGQRFDLVNAVKVPVNILFYLLPLVGLWLGFDLPGIVLLLVLSRAAALAAWAWLAFSVYPILRTRPVFSKGYVRRLFSYSLWLTLSGIFYSITSSVDRLIIGVFLTVEAVAYYSAPYEAISRIGVIPGSLSMVLFPAFSYLDANDEQGRIDKIFSGSVKFLLLTTGPLLVLLGFFAREFLGLWLGADFAARSTFVVQILAAGFLINSVIAVPNNYLLGIGRADLAAKYQAVELVIFSGLMWLGARFGLIGGVAAAASLRLISFTLVLFWFSSTAGRIKLSAVWSGGLSQALKALAGLVAGLAVFSLFDLKIAGAVILFPLFIFYAWTRVLDAPERGFFRSLLPGAGRQEIRLEEKTDR